MKYFTLLILTVTLLTACGSGRDITFREYTETTTRTRFGATGMTGAVTTGNISSQEVELFNRITSSRSLASGIAWSTPSGWKEVKETGVRLVSFRTRKNLEVTLIAFPGNVGGIRANLTRWFGQVKVNLSVSEMDNFISQLQIEETGDGGLSYVLVDFESDPGVVEKNQSETILAAIFGFSDQMLFVKLIGPKDDVKSDKVDFIKFIKSIQSKTI